MALFNNEQEKKKRIIHVNVNGALCPYCGSSKAEFLGCWAGYTDSFEYRCTKCEEEFNINAVPLNSIKVEVRDDN